jgi:hypothetical protein
MNVSYEDLIEEVENVEQNYSSKVEQDSYCKVAII